MKSCKSGFGGGSWRRAGFCEAIMEEVAERVHVLLFYPHFLGLLPLIRPLFLDILTLCRRASMDG